MVPGLTPGVVPGLPSPVVPDLPPAGVAALAPEVDPPPLQLRRTGLLKRKA